jgi:phosphatidylglycerol---prolipoprotein diacylglyceryl transferase
MLATYTHQLSPYLIEFSPGWGLRYYGLSYVLGFVFLYFGLRWHIRRGYLRLTLPQADDLLFWLTFGGVLVGGRLGYCLFYDLHPTLHDPLRLFRVWEGGMSAHGGVIGVILVLWLSARRYRLPFYQLADAAAWCTPLGLGLGRVANFINGELWGRPTDVPWAVIFPAAGDNLPRHPSQLYQAFFEGVLLFIFVALARKFSRHEGTVALTFFLGYGVLRFLGECFRQPDPHIGYLWGWLTEGQLLSVGFILVGLGLLALRRFRPRGDVASIK